MNGPFIWCKNFGRNFFRFITIHAFDRQTDGRMDGQTDRQVFRSRIILACIAAERKNALLSVKYTISLTVHIRAELVVS